MRQLPITECWNETVAFVAREAGLLFPVAFALIALPNVVFQFVSPRPEAVEQSLAAGVPPGPWIIFMIPALLLSLLGALALTGLALRPGQTVGQALAESARRLLPALGAAILLVLVGVLAALPFVMIAGLISGGNATVAGAIVTPVMLVIFVVLGVRMIFLNPVAMMEPLGPIGILRRNWALTHGQGFKLFAFLVLAMLVLLVVMLAVQFVFGSIIVLTVGSPEENDLALLLLLLINSLVNTAAMVYVTVMIARLYSKAAG